MAGRVKITIEDTGLGVTFAGEGGRYRVWTATDPNGTEFLLTTRSAIHTEPLTALAPISEHVEVTERMLTDYPTRDSLLDAIRKKTASPPKE